MVFNFLYSALGGFLAGSIPARRISSYIPEAVARFGVRYMDKKAVAPKTGKTAAGPTKTATKKKSI